jgi:hypothetical protein
MAIKGRTMVRIAAVALGLGALAWNQFHARGGGNDAAAADDRTPAATASAAPARPETWQLGSLTLTPCELGQRHDHRGVVRAVRGAGEPRRPA